LKTPRGLLLKMHGNDWRGRIFKNEFLGFLIISIKSFFRIKIINGDE